MRRFTSRFLICDMEKIHRSTAKNVRKNDGFHSSSVNFHRITIGNWEVDLRIILHPFRIHNLVLWSIAEYLIAPKVFWWFCKED